MHPEMKLELAKLRINDLHRQAAEARLARHCRRESPRITGLWAGLRSATLRTRTA